MEERTRRVRSLLEGYYGRGDSDDGSPSMANRNSSRDNIDVKGFDADGYVAKQIKETHLDGLLQQHVSWAAEMKQLDSDLQMLVYENYSKFISATDTIRKMKQNVSSMESSVSKLLSTVTGVQSKSDRVNLSLSEKRERIEELNGTRSLLRKVEYILGLPVRLRTFIKEGKLQAAVSAYQGALPLLEEKSFEAQGGSSFRSCKEESASIISSLANELQSRIMAEGCTFEERAEAAALLKQLGQPVDNLMSEYLRSNFKRLSAELASAADASTAPTAAGTTAAHMFLEDVNQEFMDDFERSVSHFRGIFFPSGHQELTAAVQALFKDYLSKLQPLLQPSAGDMSAASLMFSLRKSSKDIIRMSDLIPEAQLADMASTALEEAAKDFLMHSFALLELRISDSLQALARPGGTAGKLAAGGAFRGSGGGASGSAALPGQMQALLESTQDLVLQGCLGLLEDLEHLLDERVDLLSHCQEELRQLTHSHLHLLLSSLPHHIKGLVSGATPSPKHTSLVSSSSDVAPFSDRPSSTSSASVPPSLVLLLSRLSLFMGQTGVPQIHKELNQKFTDLSARLDDEEAPLFAPSHLSSLFNDTAQELLQQYVDIEVRKISQMVRKSFVTPNWLKYKDPRDIRMIVDLLLQEVDSIEDDVQQLLEPGEDRGRRSRSSSGSFSHSGASREDRKRAIPASSTHPPSSSSSSSAPGLSQMLERDMARLFTEKVEIFTAKLEFTQSSVLAMVVRATLKTFLETVRLQTFGRNGFQQVQLDALCLCEGLRSHVHEEQVVDSLMEEVCSAAAERSIDPTPLDVAHVESILQAKRSKLAT